MPEDHRHSLGIFPVWRDSYRPWKGDGNAVKQRYPPMGHQEMMHRCTVLGQCRSLSFTVLREFNSKNLQQGKSKKCLFAEKWKWQSALKLRSASSNGVWKPGAPRGVWGVSFYSPCSHSLSPQGRCSWAGIITFSHSQKELFQDPGDLYLKSIILALLSCSWAHTHPKHWFLVSSLSLESPANTKFSSISGIHADCRDTHSAWNMYVCMCVCIHTHTYYIHIHTLTYIYLDF
jgi:hypothetical protein